MVRKKKSEFGIASGLVFALLGALICSMLFEGEPRTYGQLVSVAIGPTVGSTEWWKSKSLQFHYAVIVLSLGMTIIVAARHHLLNAFKYIFNYGKH